jgi:hypothetical protein
MFLVLCVRWIDVEREIQVREGLRVVSPYRSPFVALEIGYSLQDSPRYSSILSQKEENLEMNTKGASC